MLITVDIYRHEEGHVLTEFFNVIDDLVQSYKNIIILGDFNVNLLNNTFHSRHLIDAINEHSLYLVPYGATIVTMLPRLLISRLWTVHLSSFLSVKPAIRLWQGI